MRYFYSFIEVINFHIKFQFLDIIIIFLESEKDRHRINKKNDTTAYLYCFINKYIFIVLYFPEKSLCKS